MATVTLSHTWADGSITEACVEVDASFPDCIAEAKAAAVAALSDAVTMLGGE